MRRPVPTSRRRHAVHGSSEGFCVPEEAALVVQAAGRDDCLDPDEEPLSPRLVEGVVLKLPAEPLVEWTDAIVRRKQKVEKPHDRFACIQLGLQRSPLGEVLLRAVVLIDVTVEEFPCIVWTGDGLGGGDACDLAVELVDERIDVRECVGVPT